MQHWLEEKMYKNNFIFSKLWYFKYSFKIDEINVEN